MHDRIKYGLDLGGRVGESRYSISVYVVCVQCGGTVGRSGDMDEMACVHALMANRSA